MIDLAKQLNIDLKSWATTINAPKAGRKYAIEIPLCVVGGALCLFLVAMLIYFGWDELMGPDARLDSQIIGGFMVSTLTALGIFMGVILTRHSILERALYLRTKDQEILLSDQGLKISIALFEGSGRDQLRKAKSPYLHLQWDQISEFIVQPAKGAGRKSSPPYYKIKASHSEEAFFVTRGPLKHKELEFLKHCHENLKCPLIIEDETCQFTQSSRSGIESN